MVALLDRRRIGPSTSSCTFMRDAKRLIFGRPGYPTAGHALAHDRAVPIIPKVGARLTELAFGRPTAPRDGARRSRHHLVFSPTVRSMRRSRSIAPCRARKRSHRVVLAP